MSGLNPFRLRPSEDTPGYRCSPSPSISTNKSTFVSPSNAPPMLNNRPQKFNGLPVTPHKSLVPDTDDSNTSDDQSAADPFHHDSYASESDDDLSEKNIRGEVDRGWNPSHYPRRSPEDDRPQFQASGRAAPHSAPSSNPSAPTTAIAPSAASAVKPGSKEHPDDSDESEESEEYYKALQGNTVAAKPSVHVQSMGTDTASSSSTDVSQFSTYTETSNHPVMGKFSSEVNAESKPLPRRPSNKEKAPPPPPKSHHGKRIHPSPAVISSPPQTTSTKSSNRFSFHGSSPETAFTHTPTTPSQLRTEYFTTATGDHGTQSTDSLRRSQSHYKRPPTPPLSRRHSQMRRTKSTFSKPSPARLSMQPGDLEVKPTPPSPDTRSSASSMHRRSRSSMLLLDETAFKLPSLYDDYDEEPTNSSKSAVENSRVNPVRRISYTNSQASSGAPPPPPPRRARGSSNHSNDSTRPRSFVSENKVEGEDYIPHPSNANDILADLSRLQKEVDDLRGHYENRKVS